MNYRGNIKYQIGGEFKNSKKSYNPNLARYNSAFQQWYNTNTIEGQNSIPYSDKFDYDYLSYFMNNDYKNYQGGHFPDTYKRPNHSTFSNESIYSTPENPGGSWLGNKFNPRGNFQYQTGGSTESQWHPDEEFNEGLASYNPTSPYYTAPKIDSKTTGSKLDPYFLMKGVTNGLSWLSGMADRNRQNQYMRQQYSTLGQLQPTPVQDYQPTPFSLYARYGGSLKRYQIGGRTLQEVTVKSRKPIMVDNPNDPRLKSYNDSLDLYNKGVVNKGKLIDARTNKIVTKEDQDEAFYWFKDMDHTGSKEGDHTQAWADWQRTGILPDREYIGAYKPSGSNLNGTFLQGQDTPTRYEWGYKKPVQPVVYQKPIPPERKDYPLRNPNDYKAQAKITITPAAPTTIPEPEGQPVYGPSNGLIGYMSDKGFQATLRRDHLSKANQADIDLLNNPEALNKYVSTTPRFRRGGMYKGGGWISKATANMRRDHPCTGSKFGSSDCPEGSRRYNLAKTFRKMAKK